MAASVPLMLAASWIACGFVLRRRPVAPQMGPRLVMGAVAFAVLIGLELLVGIIGFGRPVA